MNAALPVHAIGFFPEGFSDHSGLWQVIRMLGVDLIRYRATWERLQRQSWTAGHMLRQWGVRHYGSTWNALVPWWDEARFLRALPRSAEPCLVHFFEGEFGSPKRPEPYRR